MKKKYNLALIPLSQSDVIIELSRELAFIADRYRLGKESLPHVTLYQFEAEEDEIDNLWQRVSNHWHEAPLELTFKTFSCTTRDNVTFWAALMPDKVALLHKMHSVIAADLKLPVKDTFDPHMTLINTRQSGYEAEVEKLATRFKSVKDLFVLALGYCDEAGQLTRVIDTLPRG